MLLACDIGNTNFKFALFDHKEPLKFVTVAAHKFTRALLEQFSFNQAAISSVIPDRTIELKRLFIEDFKCRPFIINHQVNFNINIEYNTPITLGIDRICSVEGALRLFQDKPQSVSYTPGTVIMTIDSGTATTINIVEYDKRFTGGMIMPGLDTMFSSLNKNTAQLPRVTSDAFSSFIGRSTEASIASGVLNSTLGLIDRTYQHLTAQGFKEIIIYLTGGNGAVLSRHLFYPHQFYEDLVLRGIQAVFERNKGD